MCACEVTQLCLTLCDPHGWQPTRLLCHGILQARIWSGLPFPPPGDLPDPEIEPGSLLSPALVRGILTASATWEPHKCTNATRPPGLFLKQLRSHFLPYHFHAQHSSSGPTSGVCTRNPLPLLTLRIECSASLSSWNLAEPKASQKAVLFLPVGSVQLPLDSACPEGSEWGPGACWDSVPAALGGLLRTIKEAW